MIKLRAEIKEESNYVIEMDQSEDQLFYYSLFEKTIIKQTKISAETDQEKEMMRAHTHTNILTMSKGDLAQIYRRLNR